MVFVDLSFMRGGWDIAVGALRSIPPHLVSESSALVLRSPVTRWHADPTPILTPGSDWPATPDELASKVESRLREHRLPTRSIGAFELPVGAEAVTAGTDAETLARCRAVELRSYLTRNAGIWTPKKYHYQLPSRHHVGAFVRIADAFKDPFAAPGLARWLYGDLTETTSVVVDSGTLMPIVAQLDHILRCAALKRPMESGLASVEAVDRYPTSRFEYLRRFKGLSGTDILALLSVSSTGDTFRTMVNAMTETTHAWKAHCFVSRSSSQTRALESPAVAGKRDAWLGLTDLGPAYSPGDDCPLCRDDQRAQVVHINPRSFATMALPEPVLVMPDLQAAKRNASIFEWYQALGEREDPVIQLAATEQSRIRANPFHRKVLDSKVRFEPLALLLDEAQLSRKVSRRIIEIRKLTRPANLSTKIQDAIGKLERAAPTLAICDPQELEVLARLIAENRGRDLEEEAAEWTDAEQSELLPEHRSEAEKRFLTLARSVCPTVQEMVPCAAGEVGIDRFKERISEHESFLIVVSGLQSGVTLQHLLVATQDQLRDRASAGIQIAGLVLHAHPSDSAAWGSVRNSFGGKTDPTLLALWLTYLPGRSPFDHERGLVAIQRDAWITEGSPESELWTERQRWLHPASNPEAPNPPKLISPLLSPEVVTLRRTSIFGELSDRALIVAMGSALHEAFDKRRADGDPEWVRVDLPNAMRSYFDGLLHAALLRWTPPERVWWGSENECLALISEVRERLEKSWEWPFLLAELLLAAGLGKVPAEGCELLLHYVEEDREDMHPDRWPHVAMAAAFARNLVERPPEEPNTSA